MLRWAGARKAMTLCASQQGCSGDTDTQVGLLEPDGAEEGKKIDRGVEKRKIATHEFDQEKKKKQNALS